MGRLLCAEGEQREALFPRTQITGPQTSPPHTSSSTVIPLQGERSDTIFSHLSAASASRLPSLERCRFHNSSQRGGGVRLSSLPVAPLAHRTVAIKTLEKNWPGRFTAASAVHPRLCGCPGLQPLYPSRLGCFRSLGNTIDSSEEKKKIREENSGVSVHPTSALMPQNGATDPDGKPDNPV